jgi:hypothetical protein
MRVLELGLLGRVSFICKKKSALFRGGRFAVPRVSSLFAYFFGPVTSTTRRSACRCA